MMFDSLEDDDLSLEELVEEIEAEKEKLTE